MSTLGDLRLTSRNAIGVFRGFVRITCRPGVTVGALPQVLGTLRFRREGMLRIGDRFFANGSLSPVYIAVGESARLTIGDHVYLNTGSSIISLHEIHIGNHVMLAPYAAVIDDHRHEVEPGTPLSAGPTIIEDNVWLGRGVLVMPGVRIGTGSVIGAGSVVTKDVPARVLAAGSPARVIRELALVEGWVRT